MVSDARYNTKIYFEKYYNPQNALDDNNHALGVQFMIEDPDYSMELEFKAPSVIDVIVSIGEPNSEPLEGHDAWTAGPYGYLEHIPLKIWVTDKDGVTASKAKWQVENELRRIIRTYPEGSQRQMQRRSGEDKILGSTYLACTELVMVYERLAT